MTIHVLFVKLNYKHTNPVHLFILYSKTVILRVGITVIFFFLNKTAYNYLLNKNLNMLHRKIFLKECTRQNFSSMK